MEFVEKPIQFLKEVLKTLDSPCKAAIALIFMNNGKLSSPLAVEPETEHTLRLLGATEGEVRLSLATLEGSLVKFAPIDGDPKWLYKHPTIRDSFASVVAENPELLDIYLKGALPANMMQEVSCGLSNITGAKVIIPHKYYPLFIHLIDGEPLPNLLSFLSSRCDKEFLKLFMDKHPGLINKVIDFGGRFYSIKPEVRLLTTMHGYGLLPDNIRRDFVLRIKKSAFSEIDMDFLSHGWIRAVFTKDEIYEAIEEIRTGILPCLYDIIQDKKSEYPSHSYDDPENHFYFLRDSLRIMRREFDEDSIERVSIDSAMEYIDNAIELLKEEYSQREDASIDELEFGEENPSSERSIFDDVDQ
jgi:hypothetical protein